jgi:hypothetical protein
MRRLLGASGIGATIAIVAAAVMMLVLGAQSFAAHRSATPRVGSDVGSRRTVRAVVRGGHAAWYVGSTSAGTPVNFRLSPSGLWVRDVRFGAPAPTCAPLVDGNFPLGGLPVTNQAFSGQRFAFDETPDAADQRLVAVSGRFIDGQHVTGTVQSLTRGCGSELLTFTATRRQAAARAAHQRRPLHRTDGVRDPCSSACRDLDCE